MSLNNMFSYQQPPPAATPVAAPAAPAAPAVAPVPTGTFTDIPISNMRKVSIMWEPSKYIEW